jgi:hypothetical protein
MPSTPHQTRSPEQAIDRPRLRRVEALFRRYVLAWPTAIGALAVAVSLIPGFRVSLPGQVSGAQSDIYAAVAGAAGTLLGFSLAALAFLVALPQEAPLLRRLRDQGTHDAILRYFASATVYLGVLLLMALVGLFVDRQPDQTLDVAHLGLGAYWVWTVVAFAVPGATWMVRATLALIGTLPVIVSAQRGRTGRRPPPEDCA